MNARQKLLATLQARLVQQAFLDMLCDRYIQGVTKNAPPGGTPIDPVIRERLQTKIRQFVGGFGG